MTFKRRWAPSASQRKTYGERMRTIEAKLSEPAPEGYDINCTGDCVIGDEVTFFHGAKASERFFGIIRKESYGAEKQQHTFTIELGSGEMMLIKGRNLYKQAILRKKWSDESLRVLFLKEKHERGEKAREAATNRKEEKRNNIDTDYGDTYNLYQSHI